jgi:hypothetical protein
MLAHTAAGQKLRGQLLRKSKWLSRSIISSERNDRKMVKMKKKGKTMARDLAKPYEPAPQERAAVEAYFARKKATHPRRAS